MTSTKLVRARGDEHECVLSIQEYIYTYIIIVMIIIIIISLFL